MKLVNPALRVAAALVASLLVGCSASDPGTVERPAPSTSRHASEPGVLGVFSGTERPDLVDDFERWLGRRVAFVLDYVGASSTRAPDPWAGIDDPSARCGAWSRDPRRLVLSVAILPTDRQSLRAGAQGQYDEHWRRFGASLVANGCADAVLRLGWELNGRFYPWAAGGRETAFVGYWRRIVTNLRSVPAQQFSFEWNLLAGNANADVEAAYPGDDVVDVIGLDAYDTSSAVSPDDRWQDQLDRPYGLRWHERFAAEHRKPMAFSEWGVTQRPRDHLGGGDAPAYVERMVEWIRSHDIAYAIYFDVDADDAAHQLSERRFPKAAAAFRRRAVELAGPVVG